MDGGSAHSRGAQSSKHMQVGTRSRNSPGTSAECPGGSELGSAEGANLFKSRHPEREFKVLSHSGIPGQGKNIESKPAFGTLEVRGKR